MFDHRRNKWYINQKLDTIIHSTGCRAYVYKKRWLFINGGKRNYGGPTNSNFGSSSKIPKSLSIYKLNAQNTKYVLFKRIQLSHPYSFHIFVVLTKLSRKAASKNSPNFDIVKCILFGGNDINFYPSLTIIEIDLKVISKTNKNSSNVSMDGITIIQNVNPKTPDDNLFLKWFRNSLLLIVIEKCLNNFGH